MSRHHWAVVTGESRANPAVEFISGFLSVSVCRWVRFVMQVPNSCSRKKEKKKGRRVVGGGGGGWGRGGRRMGAGGGGRERGLSCGNNNRIFVHERR